MTGCVRFFLSLIFVAGIIKNAYAGPVDTCSNSTLQGTYIFSANGYDSNKYVAYTGMIFYNGSGKVKYKYKYAGSSGAFTTPPLLNGTYIVRADCQVNVTYENGRTALYFLAPSGDNLSYVITSGSLISSVVVRISRDDLISNGLGSMASDIRLKKDIELVGRSQNGHNLYRYRYLWSDQVYVGVMAQEVQARMPEAVAEGEDGFLRVHYQKLGLKLQTWEEWQAQEQTIH